MNRNVFLISAKTLKENSIVNSNVDEMYLLPAIQTAQDIGLMPLIGTKLFAKLTDLVADGSITGETNENYKILLDEYVTPYLINKVTADIQLPLSFKLRNQGVVQQTGENTYVPTIKDTQYLIEHYNYNADFYANRMSDFLHANMSKYPEYGAKSDCSEMRANPNSFNTHIYLN